MKVCNLNELVNILLNIKLIIIISVVIVLEIRDINFLRTD